MLPGETSTRVEKQDRVGEKARHGSEFRQGPSLSLFPCGVLGVCYFYLGSKGWAVVLPPQSVIGEGLSQGHKLTLGPVWAKQLQKPGAIHGREVRVYL